MRTAIDKMVRRTLPSPEFPFARARPTRVQIVEQYRYELPTDHLHRPSQTATPDGQVLVHVRYDGDRSFPRMALRDAQVGREMTGHDSHFADIGRIAFANFQGTNLSKVLSDVQRTGTTPLRVPLRSEHLRSDDDFVSDRVEYVLRRTYEPEELETIPLSVTVNVTDTPDFSSRSIVMSLDIHLIVPAMGLDPAGPDPVPVIRELSFAWPVDAAPDSVPLSFDTITADSTIRRDNDGVPLRDTRSPRYEPETRRLTWSNLPLFRRSDETEEHREYRARVYVEVRNPSQIDGQRRLRGGIDIEIPGILLSGVQARLYDATGKPHSDATLRKLTKITADITVDAPYAIQRRHVSQQLALQFLGVRPNQERINDTEKVLSERGFSLERFPGASGLDRCRCEDVETRTPVLFYRKQIGANEMRLSVSMCGKELDVERKQADATGRTITRLDRTGSVKIHLTGTLRSDHATLSRELKRIHNAVRDRFRSAHEIN